MKPRINSAAAKECLTAAFALDSRGHEAEAIPLYRRAIRLGVKGPDLRDALVCLGSSLRTVGQAHQAVRCLERARRLYPRDHVIPLFLSLACHDAGQPTKALRLLGVEFLRSAENTAFERYKSVLARKFRGLRRRS